MKIHLSLTALAALLSIQSHAAQTDFQRDVVPFLKKHCYECHDKDNAKAGFQVDDLTDDFLSGDTADRWHEVINQMNIGEMPPEKKPRPDPAEAFAVVEWVGAKLLHAEREARMAGGRILIRRLNRQEYSNTVGDLFQLDDNFIAKLKDDLPADGKAEGFDRLSSALFFDQTQMTRYLEIADRIASEILQNEPPPSEVYTWEANRHLREAERQKVNENLDHMIDAGPPNYIKTDKGMIARSANTYGAKNVEFIGLPAGPRPSLTKLVQRDGYYRIRFKGGADPGSRGEPIRVKLTYGGGSPLEQTFEFQPKGTLDTPEITELTVFLRTGEPDMSRSLVPSWNGIWDARINHPIWEKINLRIMQSTGKIERATTQGDAEMLKEAKLERENALADAAAFTGSRFIHNDNYNIDTLPQILVDTIEVEGPVAKDWPPPAQKILGLDPSLTEDERGLHSVFQRILPLAYRRPLREGELKAIVAVAQNAMRQRQLEFRDALKQGLIAMLVSPGFTFIQEPLVAATGEVGGARPLNGYEVANRLSYFLWSSMPDENLFRLAATDQLREPAQVREQAKLMLADPKARRFVENFAGQWLDVDQFGSVEPAKEYRDYDKSLENASKEEPLAFFETVLRENLPVTTFLDSDFLTINERLAHFYGIEGVQGPEFRKVALKPEHNRGGVLGMAGLLTYLADGTRTLPVRRGAWILEKLLRDPPPPPPPNAGEIQPNTAGEKLTVRERLARHRDEPSCASCHAKLDPYGLALENYDAIGAWRIQQNGEGFRPGSAPEIDPSGTLKSGREFIDLAGYKAALVAEKEKFVKALAEHLLTYALGRPVGYVDQQTIQWLTEISAKGDDRLQTLILAVVSSEPFLTK